MLCTFNAKKKEFSSLITLGTNVCGHPTIVHGGLTAAIVDETLGGLNYLLKSRGMLDPGPAFTVHMTMDWKKVRTLHTSLCIERVHAASTSVCLDPFSPTLHPSLQPIPAGSHIVCTASLDSIEGRKTWVRATVKDKPDGVEYAAGKALFVIPKKHPLDKPGDGANEQERAQAAGRQPKIDMLNLPDFFSVSES